MAHRIDNFERRRRCLHSRQHTDTHAHVITNGNPYPSPRTQRYPLSDSDIYADGFAHRNAQPAAHLH